MFFWIFPLVLSLGCAVLAIAMWTDPDVANLRRILWVAGAICALVATALWWLARYRVVIGDDGIRIRRGVTSIDLGQPRKLRCGQYERDLTVRVDHLIDVPVPTTHVWVAVEGTSGEKVLFIGSRGVVHGKLDWPTAQPPAADHVLFSNVVALRHAIGERITAG